MGRLFIRALSQKLLHWIIILPCVVFPLLFSTFGMAVERGLDSQVVKSIKIRGNRKIETDAIRSKIHTQVGLPRGRELIREDIKSIHELGFFDHIQVEEEEFEGGVQLIYIVKEKPIVSEIEFEGLDELDESEAKELCEIKQYEVLDIHKLNDSVEKLTAKYEEKGFYLADVRYKIEFMEEKGEASVTFQIDENDKIQVKKINIIGNKVLTDADLGKIMQTKEGGFFSWLTGSGQYREAVFDRDIAAMAFYYGTLGYVRARFGKPEVTVSADKKWIYVTFYLNEGKEYKVGKVDFSGDLLFTRDELIQDLKLIEGEVFNAETLRRETLRYTEKYSDLGYAFANVVPQPNIDDDTLTVNITFEVDKGQRVYIGSITVTGNTRTKDKVFRRELLIHEGELFNGTKKRLSRENVLRLGFFDSVEFHQSTSRTDPDVVNIEIRVTERSTGQLVIGAGYASGDYGFTAHAQLSQNNFLGNGQVASLSAQVITGISQYEFNLGFTEPYVGSSLWSLGGDIYQLRRMLLTSFGVPTFEDVKTGFDVKLGHPILEFTNLYLTYKAENSYVKPETIVDRSLITPESINGVSSALLASVVYDKRDDRFDPRKGWYWSLSTEFAGLGGNRRYWRSKGEVKFFHPIIWDFIFRSQFRVGSISRIGGNPIPINELFIMGGLFSLRGYDNLSIGPTAKLSTDTSKLSEKAKSYAGQDFVIGGRHEVLMNLEIEFPLLREARIRGVVFFDVGNAFHGFFLLIKAPRYIPIVALVSGGLLPSAPCVLSLDSRMLILVKVLGPCFTLLLDHHFRESKQMKNIMMFGLMCCLSSYVFANSGIRVAYVDLQKALQTVEAGKRAKSKLEKEVQKRKMQLEKQQAALQKEAEQFEKKVAILNQTARVKKQAELQKKLMEFQRKASETQMALQKRERELTKPLIDELRAIIEGIGKSRKYQIILEKNESAVLYAESGADLTDEVIKKFNSRRKK